MTSSLISSAQCQREISLSLMMISASARPITTRGFCTECTSPRAGPAITESAIDFPAGRRRPISSPLFPRASLGAPALRANSGTGESTWVASGFCAISTSVVLPHFAQRNCTRGRPASCASGRECCAPQPEHAAFISSSTSVSNLACDLSQGSRSEFACARIGNWPSVQGWNCCSLPLES